MNTQKTALPILFSLILIIGMFLGYKLKENMGSYGPSFSSSRSQIGIREILSIVDRHYIDSIQSDSLSLLAINNIMQQLDPHSVYIPASDVQFLKTELQGGFDGIGLEFELLNDTVSVIGVKRASPAEKAGLLTGAQILKINEQTVSGIKMNPELIRHLVRGPRGSSVSMLVLQNKKQSTLSIERAQITQECIDLSTIVKPGVGYIRLNRFAATAYEEFMQQLENLKSKGMHTLILDLQENGGGLLDDAVQIADEFLDNNKDIVYTEGAHSPKKTFLAKRPGLFEKGKLIVLINEHSASASEVLAGALQDWDRATIIGRRSYGKGLVQEEFSLSDGSALRLTTSRYFTPLGRNIQKPYVKGKDSLYTNELNTRYKNGDLLNNDSAKHSGKKYLTKSGRVVYGGWGITPDLFVPADSAELGLLNRMPQIFEVMASASFNYFNANKEKISAIKQPAELNAYLEKDPLLLALIKNNMGTSTSGIPSISKNAFEFECIKRYAFQYIARLSLGKEGYFSFLLLTDPVFNSAIDQLK